MFEFENDNSALFDVLGNRSVKAGLGLLFSRKVAAVSDLKPAAGRQADDFAVNHIRSCKSHE